MQIKVIWTIALYIEGTTWTIDWEKSNLHPLICPKVYFTTPIFDLVWNSTLNFKNRLKLPLLPSQTDFTRVFSFLQRERLS
jgi:hypothetical protein